MNHFSEQKQEMAKPLKPPSSLKESDKLFKQKENINFLINIELFAIYRFQIPDGQFISRYIFLCQWADDNKNIPISCCKNTANIQWHSMDAILYDIKQENRPLMDRFWGYEIIQACTVLFQQQQGNIAMTSFISPQIQEFNSNEVLKYLSRSSANLNEQRNSTQSFSQMLHEAKFTEKDVIKIYCDYVQHCFPSAAMTYCSFNEYFTRIGILQFDDISMRHIFRYFILISVCLFVLIFFLEH